MEYQRAIVINCSKPYYNLGALKLGDWLRSQHVVTQQAAGDPGLFDYDPQAVFLSVIFSWDALLAQRLALRYRDNADVFCGGPGMYALGKWWRQATDLDCYVGLDQRFDRFHGQFAYKATFASRGCPVGCWFCIVPKIEGREFSFDWDFQPAPILYDNNLSALPVEYQEHIIRRYIETETPLRDANSGFEPRTFDRDCFDRWQPILRGPWRFAFDEQREAADVERMMQILAGVSPSRKRVYVLIGNEPVESCLDRADRVIAWGGEPYLQPVLPLNALARDQFIIRHDWTAQRLKDVTRYYNRFLWRKFTLDEYVPRGRIADAQARPRLFDDPPAAPRVTQADLLDSR